jgi:tRNA nucleotidyltransferase/poly(A) polymerase
MRIAFYRGRIAGPQEQELERLFRDWLPETRFAGKVFAVGGYVRDELLGTEPHDLDVVVEMMYGAQRFADELLDAFGESVGEPVPVSLDFPIWKTRFVDDVRWNGDVYGVAGADLDIADTQTMIDLNGVSSTEFGGIDDDVIRRDFTANMLFKDLTTGEIVDPSGDGVEAIEEGILRPHPDVDPGIRFRAQPKQMLRAIRFVLRYDWDLDADIEAAMRENADALALISRRSVEKEFGKLRDEGNLEAALDYFIDFGFLPYLREAVQNV